MAGGAAPAAEAPEAHDAEMEEELAHSVAQDPLAAYDISVHEEGHAIKHFLAQIDGEKA